MWITGQISAHTIKTFFKILDDVYILKFITSKYDVHRLNQLAFIAYLQKLELC